MSKTDFVDVISFLRGAYARNDLLKDVNEVNVWFEALCDLESEWIKKAAVQWVQESKFPPAISEIRDLAKKLSNVLMRMGMPRYGSRKKDI